MPAQSSRREASTWSFFDRLDIFSDATNRKITLALLILRHTHFLGAGTNHTESATEILCGLPRSLIAVSSILTLVRPEFFRVNYLIHSKWLSVKSRISQTFFLTPSFFYFIQTAAALSTAYLFFVSDLLTNCQLMIFWKIVSKMKNCQ